MQTIEYLISALIGFGVAMIFIIIPSWYKMLKLQLKGYIETLVIDYLKQLQDAHQNDNIKSEKTKEEKK